MKILSAEFVLSAARSHDYPRSGRPEIAFIGRSNVGKSSLINSLLNRRRLAKTSRDPGKTRTLNFFFINEKFFFVDLPGYGYAKISRSLQASWKKMVEEYLTKRRVLSGCVLLVDLRHPPAGNDIKMKNWLDHWGCPTVVVATKADKVGPSARKRHLDAIHRELPLLQGQDLLLYSSRTGLGKDRLWSVLSDLADLKTG